MKPQRHPEAADDEVFITNHDADEPQRYNFETARTGMKAYNLHGQLLTGCVPIFVKKAEIIEKGLDDLYDMELGMVKVVVQRIREA